MNEPVGRNDMRGLDTLDQMGLWAASLAGKCLRYQDLVKGNELPSRRGASEVSWPMSDPATCDDR